MSKRMKRNILLVIVALVIVFILQNAAPVTTTFFVMTFEMPRAILILVVFLCGGIAGYLASATGLLHEKKKR